MITHKVDSIAALHQREQELAVKDEEVTALQLAAVEQFEARVLLEDRVTDLQLALVELYEGR